MDAAPAALTGRADIALDVTEDALRRLAEDLAARALLLDVTFDIAACLVLVGTVARSLCASRTQAMGTLTRLADALGDDPTAQAARDQAAAIDRDQGAPVHEQRVTADDVRAWAAAWAAYGDARAVGA